MLLRRIAVILLCLPGCEGSPARSQPDQPPATKPAAVERQSMTARQAYDAKQYAECARLFTADADKSSTRATDYYNAACCYALDGHADAAFAALDLAVKSGLSDVHVGIDEDLASLRSDPRWPDVWHAVQAAHEAEEAKVKDKALRDELLALVKEDQAVRNAAIANMRDPSVQARMKEIDHKTTTRLKEIVAKQGWPGKSLVGEEAAHAAWLLVQHGDADVAFQKQCLALIEKAAKAGEATEADYAYLYDRVAVGEHRPQRYGTQYGEGKPQPIEDETHVDERRKAVGLGTMAEYDAQMRAMYGRNLDGKK